MITFQTQIFATPSFLCTTI